MGSDMILVQHSTENIGYFGGVLRVVFCCLGFGIALLNIV